MKTSHSLVLHKIWHYGHFFCIVCVYFFIYIWLYLFLEMPVYSEANIRVAIEWGSYSKAHKLGFFMEIHKLLKLYVNWKCVSASVYLCVCNYIFFLKEEVPKLKSDPKKIMNHHSKISVAWGIGGNDKVPQINSIHCNKNDSG